MTCLQGACSYRHADEEEEEKEDEEEEEEKEEEKEAEEGVEEEEEERRFNAGRVLVLNTQSRSRLEVGEHAAEVVPEVDVQLDDLLVHGAEPRDLRGGDGGRAVGVRHRADARRAVEPQVDFDSKV